MLLLKCQVHKSESCKENLMESISKKRKSSLISKNDLKLKILLVRLEQQ